MHIAILKEHEDMVDYIGKGFRQTLKIGDNVSKIAFTICATNSIRMFPPPSARDGGNVILILCM